MRTVELVGSAEACRLLGISRATLTRWVKAGRLLPEHKNPHVNGAAVFDRAAVEALVAERER